MTPLEALALAGIVVPRAIDALPALRALMPERTDLIELCEDTMTKAHNFMWIDLETTGLDPAKGVVLEFAVVLCEDDRADALATVQEYDGVIHHSQADIEAARPDDVVLRMHKSNGLWHDVQHSTATTDEVDGFLASLACDLSGGKERSIILAGANVAFDRACCVAHFPRFAKYLHHNVFDVSTLKRAVKCWAHTPIEVPYAPAHRALADIKRTIEEARVLKAALFAVPA